MRTKKIDDGAVAPSKKNVEAVVAVLKRHGDFATGGGANSAHIALGWLKAGFDEEEVDAWLDARCFDPAAACEFSRWRVKPSQAATVTGPEVGRGAYRDTIGYKLANDDLSLDDLRQALRNPKIGR